MPGVDCGSYPPTDRPKVFANLSARSPATNHAVIHGYFAAACERDLTRMNAALAEKTQPARDLRLPAIAVRVFNVRIGRVVGPYAPSAANPLSRPTLIAKGLRPPPTIGEVE